MFRGRGPTYTRRFTRALYGVAALSVVAALAANAYFVVAAIFARPLYWGEHEILFEASRLRDGLPLYTDPILGATEYGPVGSHYYVLYPPLWSWVLSRLPAANVVELARLFSAVAWSGAVVVLARTAGPSCKRTASLAGAFVLSQWLLWNFATVGRPDVVACVIVAAALAMSLRQGYVPLLAAILFGVAPWLKPSVLGVSSGALLGAVLTQPARGFRATATAGTASLAIALVLHHASHGAAWEHLLRSMGQPLSWAVWWEAVPGRLPIFLPPIAAGLWAASVARGRSPARAEGGAAKGQSAPVIALFALGTSTLWTLCSLAKTGSAAVYWMEPSLASIAVLAVFPFALPTSCLGRRQSLADAAIACFLAIYSGTASVRNALDHANSYRRATQLIGAARAVCNVPLTDIVAADDSGIELTLNGRVLTTSYQMHHLLKKGLYPVGPWRASLQDPRVTVFVEHVGELRDIRELWAVIETRFEPRFRDPELTIFCARP